MANLQQQFGDAQRAFQAGEHAAAAKQFKRLLRQHPDQPAIHHMLGLALKKQGKLDDARKVFATAVERHGDVAGLQAELASLLDDLGEGEASLRHYDRALALSPDLLDARIDRALVLLHHLDPIGGFEQLLQVAEANPGSLRAWRNVVSVGRKVGRLDEAERAIEHCLRLAPGDARLLKLRAQVAHDLGRPAADLYRRARAAGAEAEAMITGEAAALLGERQHDKAVELLENQAAAQPDSYDSLWLLSQIRWQSGAGPEFAESYREALGKRPEDYRLWNDFAAVTGRALGYGRAIDIVEEARGALGEDMRLDVLEASYCTETDALDRAGELYARLAETDETTHRLSRIRYLLKRRDYDGAQALGLKLVDDGLGPQAWPYISIAWRMQEDPRWRWLEGDRDLSQVFDLDGLLPEIDAIADHLRSLHHWQTHPFEQSLRSGTQTDNELLARQEPEIRLLNREIGTAIRQYLRDLPAPQADHPVLSHPRESAYFAASWSVRLTSSGYHVSHIHTMGWISSVLYISLPETLGAGGDDSDGWLVLGEPPPEFETGLAPLKLVEPKPARLVLFPSIMWHGTRPFSQGERLTVAFDVRTN